MKNVGFNFLWKVHKNVLMIRNIHRVGTAKVKWSSREALAFLVTFQLIINFQDSFSKNPQTFRDKLFNAEQQTKRGMEMLIVTVTFRNFGTPIKMCHRSTDELRNFWLSYGQDI
jgi:hypothetical protein